MANISPRFRFRIVGLPYHDAPDVYEAASNNTLDTLVPGLICTQQWWIPLELHTDPVNTSDPNAVEVVIPARATRNNTELKLGYVPGSDSTAMSFLLGACESRKHRFGCGLRVEGLRPAIKEAVWSGEMETTGAAGFLKPSRRKPPDYEDIFPDQFNADIRAADTPRPRRRKVQHLWI